MIIVVSVFVSVDPTIGSCKIVYSQANSNIQGLLPDSSAIYSNVNCLGLLEQERIPAP